MRARTALRRNIASSLIDRVASRNLWKANPSLRREHLAVPQAFFNTEPTLYPIYVRGQAYLKTGQGQQAVAEFQKIAGLRWMNYPLGSLARLQLGRAYVLAGDKHKARTAYKDFLTLWKDADPDLSLLKEAKAEYSKLE